MPRDIPDTFRWTAESWGDALRCTSLEGAARHLFTTRQLDLTATGTGAWNALAKSLGTSERCLWRLSQVHGNAVVRAAGAAPAERPQADALVTDDPSVALVVLAADCAPLLLADTRTGAVAAVHAGWRGTAARVAIAALQTMTQEFGTRPGDVVAAIGPAIGACCYLVGPELVDAFAAAGHERYLIDRWFQVRRDGRLRLDVPGANRDQLILGGVPEARIHLAGLCTAMNLDLVTSYRVEKDRAGRIAGVIRRA